MNSQLFFIYDSHCPWSYATTALVNSIHSAYPEMPMHLWHFAHYDGSDSAGKKQVDAVANQSAVEFGEDYLDCSNVPQNATLAANLMAWVSHKHPELALKVLTVLQQQHFIDNTPFTDKADFSDIAEQFKLSPPGKVFKSELTKDAEFALGEIGEMQDIIATTAFPALMLAVGDRLVLLNHNLYLTKPDAIVEAVAQELNA
ncbi:protein disulfide-isomerase [Thalassotalea sp. ND16A]|uniref:protein disulfide-isomerase n=1 Tax=Thalassotalea sp. ND16A TaxID=1535422 RepID=UPI000519F537|nr:protein disulfide-isomerase [Thalassotalea sp. ND16A]KGJ95730.1 hypothetical protein ND16A_1265 [Thalassotalea sp. ND16A]